MSGFGYDLFEELDNTTAKVVYYSCLAKAMTISEIAEKWGYKSANYFYQQRQKRLIDRLEKGGLLIVESDKRGKIKSNYEILLNNKRIDDLIKKVNLNLTMDLLYYYYDYDIKRELMYDNNYRNFLIENKTEVKDLLNDLLLKDEDVKILLDVLMSDKFRETFLSIDVIMKICEKRNRLPENPTEFIYNLIIALIEDIYMYKEGIITSFYIYGTDFLDISDEAYGVIIQNYNKNVNNKLFINLMELYSMFSKKNKIYEDKDIEDRPNLDKFINIIEKEANNKL